MKKKKSNQSKPIPSSSNTLNQLVDRDAHNLWSRKILEPLLPQLSFFKRINCSQILAWTGELVKLNLNDSFSFWWRLSGNLKNLTPGGLCRNRAWKVLTMWPSGAGSPAQCRRAWRSCAPRLCGPSEGCQSPGPFDWDAPGTWCVQMPFSAPEEWRRGGVTGHGQIKMGLIIAIWLRMDLDKKNKKTM